MNRIDKIKVYYHDREVGTMALYKERFAAFEYSSEWINTGFSISPLSLPLQKKVFIPKIDPFEGLYGVFADSLPDGWGRLLVDRLMRRNGMDPQVVGNLERLAIVGSSGMGALTYRPVLPLERKTEMMSLDTIAKECTKILNSEDSYDLDYLFAMGGSSGGARPKILTSIDGEDWIIKFPSSSDSSSIGKQEYDFARCAVSCGIRMSESRLFPSKISEGYFGTKRFDRKGNREIDKLHMISVSALMETSHRIPNLDYALLMKLTLKLTNSIAECEKMYRLMCFNVFAHNRDDHSKNFSFIYDEADSCWLLSPAYDLTYSNSIGGEHATSVNGNGKDPSIDDILPVAKNIGIDARKARSIAKEIQEKVNSDLMCYLGAI